MKRMIVPVTLVMSFALLGCTRDTGALEVKAGSDVTLQKRDGVTVNGRLVEAKGDRVVIENRDGVKTQVARTDIQSLRATPVASDTREADRPVGSTGTLDESAAPTRDRNASASATRGSDPRDTEPARDISSVEYREVTVPAGTVLPLELKSTVSSATSHVEDPVHATLRRSIAIKGVTALPAGTAVVGHVTNAKRSARIKGRGQVGFRFTQVDLPGEGGRLAIRTSAVGRVAPGTKKRDAAEIGGGAVGGAIIGGIVGGGKGAAKGGAVGGAAGTGVVLATRGKDVAVRAGTPVSVRLLAPLTVRVRVK
jgi:hypothetical protein